MKQAENNHCVAAPLSTARQRNARMKPICRFGFFQPKDPQPVLPLDGKPAEPARHRRGQAPNAARRSREPGNFGNAKKRRKVLHLARLGFLKKVPEKSMQLKNVHPSFKSIIYAFERGCKDFLHAGHALQREQRLLHVLHVALGRTGKALFLKQSEDVFLNICCSDYLVVPCQTIENFICKIGGHGGREPMLIRISIGLQDTGCNLFVVEKHNGSVLFCDLHENSLLFVITGFSTNSIAQLIAENIPLFSFFCRYFPNV